MPRGRPSSFHRPPLAPLLPLLPLLLRPIKATWLHPYKACRRLGVQTFAPAKRVNLVEISAREGV